MFSTVRCTKRVCVGLFSIDEGTVWDLEGIKYDNDLDKSTVHICEHGTDSVWAEIPQRILADCFELV